MNSDFSQLLSTLSDSRLQEYIDKREKYNPGAVLAAIEEFKRRGRIFTDTEIETIKSDLQQQQEISEERSIEPGLGFNKWDQNIISNDPMVPELYSEGVIYAFSILFSVLFGSVLMGMNLYRIKNKKGMGLVIAFGFVYTILEIVILSSIQTNSGIALIFSIGGALIINNVFWPKYIGKGTEYRKRLVWGPLAIALGLTALLIFLILSGNK